MENPAKRGEIGAFNGPARREIPMPQEEAKRRVEA